MSDPITPHAETIVPVKVAAPPDHAPPSLAEPASGPVAEISAALTNETASATESKPIDAAVINGEAPSAETAPAGPATTESSKPSEPVPASAPAPAPTADEDVEMKDDTQPEAEATASPSAPAAETNGSASSKSKRKSSTGVPEHRSKTLKKKQSKQKITNLDAEPGNYYLARLRSFPPWPSVICDEDMLPEVLLKTRPVTAIQSDGTYKEPYVDGGKKVMDRTYAVMFLQTNEFGWIPNTDLTPLEPEQCKDVSEKGKAKALIEAYKIAAEGYDLQHFKDMLIQHEAALQEDEERKAQREAEKAAKADKKKRKSDVKQQDDDVEMEDAEEAAPKKSSKKRKKDAESDDEEPEKPAKTPKTTKLKLTTGKTPTTDKKSTEKKTPKPKSEKKKKAAAAAESSDEVEPEKEEEPPLDPVEARKAREKEVLFLRHKLQKGFLSRDLPPIEDEMPQMNTYIKKLEAYDDKIEVSIIRNTKINKVLKALVKLNTIPKDEEYHFRERAVKLLGIWNPLLGAEPADDKPGKDEKASPTTTNGVHKDVEKEVEEKADEKIEKEVEEPKDNVLSSDEAVDKISTEVTADAETKAEAIEAIQKEEKPAEETKTETPAVPATLDKAPESAAAAVEATSVVKDTE